MQHTHAPPADPPVGGSAQPWSQYGQPQTIWYPQWVCQGGLFLPVYVPYPYPGPFSVPRPFDSQVDAAGKPTDNSQSQHSRPASDHSRSQRQPPSTHPSHPPKPPPTHPSHSQRHRRQRERPETSNHTSVPTNNERYARKQSKKTAPPTQLRQDPPDYLFLSIGSTNELIIEGGMYQTLRDKLGEHVFPRWGRGLMSPSDAFDDNWWCVRFAGEPWSSSSHEDSLAARDVLNCLFVVLYREGYSYLSTANTFQKSCQLVLGRGKVPPSEQKTCFFNIRFPQNRQEISFRGVPANFLRSLGKDLQAAFPNKLKPNIDGRSIQLEMGQSNINSNAIPARILQFCKSQGFDFAGSLPMGGESDLGEVWMFRGEVPSSA